jgi:hypothetical protein
MSIRVRFAMMLAGTMFVFMLVLVTMLMVMAM